MGKSKPKSSGLKLDYAPSYHPTAEQFDDPLQYIASIREEAEKYGLARIVPPKGWKPPYALDRDKFRFVTRVQSVNQLMKRANVGDIVAFHKEYKAFLAERGTPLTKTPVFGGKNVDMCALYHSVCKQGGADKVTERKLWKEISRTLKTRENLSSASFQLRQLYMKHLYAFEVQQHPEFKRGKEQKAPHRTKTVNGSSDKKPFAPSDAKGLSSESAADKVMDDAEAMEALLGLGEGPKSSEKKPAKSKLEQGLEEVVQDELSGDSEDGPRLDQMCEICNGGVHEELMILCDKCDCGYHMYCLAPPLEELPEDDWFCPRCIAAEKNAVDIGFLPGGDYSLNDFGRMANEFKARYFQGKTESGKVDPLEVETEFWRIVEEGTQTAPVEVLYGADLDTGVLGSGFPKADGSQYSTSGWNLNNIANLGGVYPSLLRHVTCPGEQAYIPGVIVPWLYVGMMFSSFCWHFEDHMFYSINYCHWGEPKMWYCVPGDAADAFEEVFKAEMPDLFAAQPDLLMQLVTMLPPAILKKHGVPVYRAIQNEGDFMVTFPRSYHGGFNCGYNCAEAVNFAPPDWLRYGKVGVERYRFYRRASVLSLEELLYDLGRNEQSPEAARWVLPELQGMIVEEKKLREEVAISGTTRSQRMRDGKIIKAEIKREKAENPEDDEECDICHYYTYTSGLVCDCSVDRIACLHHSHQLCDCDPSARTLFYRHTIAELEDLLDQVRDSAGKVSVPCYPCADSATQRYLPPPAPSIMEDKAWKAEDKARAARAAKWTKAAEALLAEPAEEDVKPFEQGGALAACDHALRQLQEMQAQAEEFVWGCRKMAAIRDLNDRLETASTWAQELLMCVDRSQAEAPAGAAASSAVAAPPNASAQGGPVKVALPRLQELLEVSPRPIHLPVLPILEQTRNTAQELSDRIDACMATDPRPIPQTLQKLVQEASRLPVHLPALKPAREALAAAAKWQDKVRKALPTNKRQRGKADGVPSLARVREMQREGERLPVSTHEWSQVVLALEQGEAMSIECRDLIKSKPNVTAVQAQLAAAQELPLTVPEMAQMEGLVEAADQWCVGMQTAVARQASLKELRDILHTGERLAVGLAQLDDLRLVLRARTCQLAVNRALTNLMTMNHVTEVLTEAEATQLKTPEVDELASRHKAAAEWKVSMEGLLTAASAPEPRALKSMDEAVALLTLAGTICMKVDGYRELNVIVDKARGWQARVNVHAHLLKGIRLQARRERVKSTYAGKVAGGEAAMEEAGSSISTAALAALVQEGRTLSVHPKELDLLDKRLQAAQAWEEQVRGALAAAQGASAAAPADGDGDGAAAAAAPAAPAGAVLTDPALRTRLLGRLHVLRDEGEALEVEVAGLGELQRRIAVFEWARDASAALAGRPTLALMEEAAAQGKELAAHAEELGEECAAGVGVLQGQVATILAAAHAWLHSASRAAHSKRTAQEVQEMVAEGNQLKVSLEEVRALERGVSAHLEWVKQAEAATARAAEGERPTQADLEALLEQSEGIPVSCGEWKDRLEHIIQEAKSWLQRCHKAIAKRKSTVPASGEEGLAILAESVHKAIVTIEPASAARPAKRTKRSAKRGSKGTAPAPEEPAEEPEVYCLCRRGDEGGTMLACDDCGDWFHPKCLGLSAAATRNLTEYFCPICAAGKGAPYAAPGGLVYVTCQPSIGTLEELLEAAQALECQPEGMAALQKAVEGYARLQRCVEDVITAARVLESSPEGIDLSNTISNTDALPLVSRSGITKLVKATTGLEVDASDLTKSMTVYLSQAGWRSRALTSLKAGGTKYPNMRALAKLRREAHIVGFKAPDSPDPVFRALVAREEAARQWIERATAAVEDLSVSVEAVQALVKEGEELPVTLDSELKELRERCELYCSCRQPYDDTRPMIACDHCSGWFHYECVNMPAPNESDDEDENVPEEYMCKECCTARGLRYAYDPRPPSPPRNAIDDDPAQYPNGAGNRYQQPYQHLPPPPVFSYPYTQPSSAAMLQQQRQHQMHEQFQQGTLTPQQQAYMMQQRMQQQQLQQQQQQLLQRQYQQQQQMQYQQRLQAQQRMMEQQQQQQQQEAARAPMPAPQVMSVSSSAAAAPLLPVNGEQAGAQAPSPPAPPATNRAPSMMLALDSSSVPVAASDNAQLGKEGDGQDLGLESDTMLINTAEEAEEEAELKQVSSMLDMTGTPANGAPDGVDDSSLGW